MSAAPQDSDATAFRYLMALCALPVAVIAFALVALILSRHTMPQRCYMNTQTTDTPIETRNYSPAKSWPSQEWGWCFNPNKAGYEGCWKSVDHYEAATFERRYVGTEDWAKESREPDGTDNERPYRRVTEYDVQVCDGRSEYADRNGRIESHHVTVGYYI